jgi:hypothetical protein
MTTLGLARPRDQAAARPAGHRWLMLAVLLGGQFMVLLDKSFQSVNGMTLVT